MVLHDQARAPLAGHIRPHPLNEDADAKARLAKKLEMHRGPCQPRNKAADPYAPGLQDGKPFADHRHVPFVEVAERTRCGFPRDPSMNQLSCIASLLLRDLSNSGERLSFLELGRVAHHENVWIPWYGEIALHFDSSRAIRLHRKPLPRR